MILHSNDYLGRVKGNLLQLFHDSARSKASMSAQINSLIDFIKEMNILILLLSLVNGKRWPENELVKKILNDYDPDVSPFDFNLTSWRQGQGIPSSYTVDIISMVWYR